VDLPLESIERAPGVLSSGVKRPGRRGDRSFPSIAEVKNYCSDTFNSHVCLHVVFRGSFTFNGETTHNVAGVR